MTTSVVPEESTPPKSIRPVPEMSQEQLAMHRMLATAQGTIEEMQADAAAAVKRLREVQP